jgi:hypothetical protein
MAVLSSSENFNLDVDMAGMYRREMDVQGRKCATRVMICRKSPVILAFIPRKNVIRHFFNEHYFYLLFK